jgi:hypothetical protein
VVASVLVLNSVNSVLAPQISLGGGQPIEFGQGSQLLAACDSSILINLGSEWNQSSSIFRISSITLSDLDTTTDHCFGKQLTIQVLDISGNVLDINPDSDSSGISFVVSGNQSTTETRELAIDSSILVDATLITRVTVETA